VNYNVKYFVEQCLYTVINACKNIEAEIIVIDNNSSDGSQAFFSDKFNHVHFIWNKENVGFSKANNAALRQASGKYILFLNPDTIIPEDCFEKCLAFFETKKEAGALGVRMIDGSGKFLKESKRGFPGLETSFFKLTGLTALFPHSKRLAHYYLGNLPENENHVIDVLAGAFMMVEKEVLESIGAFDEDFFMYGEDIDLSYRVQKAGYKIFYFSEATIIHFKGESTVKGSLEYVKIFYGAMYLFVKKHYSKIKALLYGVFIKVAMLLKATIGLIKKIFSSVKKPGVKPVDTSATLVVGDEYDYQSVIKLLNEADSKLRTKGRVAVADDSPVELLGSLEFLDGVIKEHAIENIIFCINQLSAKEVVKIIQNIKQPVGFMFHVAGSKSIISSSDKDEAGTCIATN
jgi:GT2 family glycosyltransferase